MRKSLLFIAAFVTILVFEQCSAPTEKSNDSQEQVAQSNKSSVVLYGSNSCDHCTDFKAELDSVGVEYTFHDVEQNQALANEMLNVVHSIGYYDYIMFPVVAAGDTVFIKPNLQDVLDVL